MPSTFTTWAIGPMCRLLDSIGGTLNGAGCQPELVERLECIQTQLGSAVEAQSNARVEYAAVCRQWADRERVAGVIYAVDLLEVSLELVALAELYGDDFAKLPRMFFDAMNVHYCVDCMHNFEVLRPQLAGDLHREAEKIYQELLTLHSDWAKQRGRNGSQEAPKALRQASRKFSRFLSRNSSLTSDPPRIRGLAAEMERLYKLQDALDLLGA